MSRLTVVATMFLMIACSTTTRSTANRVQTAENDWYLPWGIRTPHSSSETGGS